MPIRAPGHAEAILPVAGHFLICQFHKSVVPPPAHTHRIGPMRLVIQFTNRS